MRHHDLIRRLIAELCDARAGRDAASERADEYMYAADEASARASRAKNEARRSANEAREAEDRRRDEESNREDATRQLKRAREWNDPYGEAEALKKLERGW